MYRPIWLLTGFLIVLLPGLSGCATVEQRRMEATAYCGCGECCGWERGSWRHLKLDFWRRHVTVGSRAGQPYTGRTASGTKPRVPRPGLLSGDTLRHPWMIPFRLMPWWFLPRAGTIAADTDFYPFGTRIDVPGWGSGIVEDRGSAIRGPDRLDLYHRTHRQALRWGRQQVTVLIERPRSN